MQINISIVSKCISSSISNTQGSINQSRTYAYGSNWKSEDDKYIYYALPLGPGETTPDPLNVTITRPTDLEDGESFNVIVVYEAVPVKYDTEGEPVADWTQKIIEFKEQG